MTAMRPTDLWIRVKRRWSNGCTTLEYVLESPSSLLPFHDLEVSGPRFEGSPDEFQRRILGEMEALRMRKPDGARLTEREVEDEAVSIGQSLFRTLFSGEMQRRYRQIESDAETLLVTSDDPWIPWEFLHDGTDFLCLRFRMGRWLAGRRPPVADLEVGNVLALRAEPPGTEWDETEILRGLVSSDGGVRGIFESEVSFDRLRKLLAESRFDLLHWSGHGEHVLDRDADPRILAADRPFRPRNVSAEARSNLGTQRPFVFLNSCQVGRVAQGLTGLAGWAPPWIESGCSGFLAPVLPVSAAGAYDFARLFYDGLADGLDLGTALQKARRDLRARHPADLAWLAYVLYGTPRARLVFGKTDDESAIAEPLPGPYRREPSHETSREHTAPITDLGPDRGSRATDGSTGGSPRQSAERSRHNSWLRRLLAASLVGAVLAAGYLFLWHQLGSEVTESSPVKRDPVSNPAADSEENDVSGSGNPPTETDSTRTERQKVPMVPGRIAVLPTASLDSSLESAVRRSLRSIDGVEPLMVDGIYPKYSPGPAAPGWGAQYLLFVEAEVQDIGDATSNIKKVSLSLDGILMDASNGTEIEQFFATHTGAGGSTDAALRQAAERCLLEITDNLRERTSS